MIIGGREALISVQSLITSAVNILISNRIRVGNLRGEYRVTDSRLTTTILISNNALRVGDYRGDCPLYPNILISNSGELLLLSFRCKTHNLIIKYMQIGSHNTMTYLPVKRRYMKLFNWIAKCQDLTLYQQYCEGIRVFDFRIAYDKYGNPEFAHGLVKYRSGRINHYLKYINDTLDKCVVRIILESEKNNGIKLFKNNVNNWIRLYKNITFIQGNSKKNWNKIVNLKDFDGEQLVSSMKGKGLLRIFPRLYAIINNNRNRIKYKNTNKIYLMDFIGQY